MQKRSEFSQRPKAVLSYLLASILLSFGSIFLFVSLLAGTQEIVQGAGGVHYVSPGGVDAGDCTNSGSPCATVQYAVDQAGVSEEIRVATGTYSGVSLREGVTQSVYISKSINIRGGYPTDFGTPPDPDSNPTIVDAQNLGRIFFISDNSVVHIEGLQIVNGNGYVAGGPNNYEDFGGGIYILTGTVTLSNNIIMNNSAYAGGGLYTGAGSNLFTMLGNTISDNYGETFGAGLHIRGNVLLEENLIISNTTPRDGGGIYYAAGNGELKNNMIVSNTAGNRGGGMYMGGGPILVQNNVFKNNTAECSAGQSFPGGGGLYLRTANGTVVENTILENHTGCFGGGIRVESSSALVKNNLILSNTTDFAGGGMDFLLSGINGPSLADGNTIMFNQGGYGGGVSIATARANLINNQISHNYVLSGAGAINITLSYVTLEHSTIAKNTGGNGSGIGVTYSFVTMTNNIVVSHSVGISLSTEASVTLEATLWGADEWANGVDWTGINTPTTSLDVYGHPMFVDPDAQNYHITTASAAFNSGVDVGVDHDIDGDFRPSAGAPDVGADEVLPGLVLVKTAPTSVVSGAMITYQLTVLNNLSETVTNVVLTDSVPTNANYVSGGTLVGNVVSWTLPTLSGGSTFTQYFVVTATETITNDDYRVSADGNISTTSHVPVVTFVLEPDSWTVFMPIVRNPENGAVEAPYLFSQAVFGQVFLNFNWVGKIPTWQNPLDEFWVTNDI